MTCDQCEHFNPATILCHRYPSRVKVVADHWCGEWKSSKKRAATATVFKKPTLNDVKEYIQSRRSRVDAEEWMDFYQSKGWKIGKSPMKDWKAAVRTWEKGDAKVSAKDCVDCGAAWKVGFKFVTDKRGKIQHRCVNCNNKRKQL